MSVCPVYQVTRMETDVARGKLAILQEVESGRLDLSSDVSEILSRCLSCGACAEVCANNVQSDILIQQGRQQGFLKRMPMLPYTLLKTMAPEDLSRSMLIKGGALLEKLLCNNIPESSGLYLRFPFSFFVERTTIPWISWTSFLEGCLPEVNKARGEIRVGFFVGCGTNYLFPETGHAALEILEQVGISPFIPKQQGCCGLMAYTAGDRKRAVTLAKHTIDLFSGKDLDYIITTCAGCGAHLKVFPELFDKGPGGAKAERFSGKVMDAITFLIDVVGYDTVAQGSPSRRSPARRDKVVYHDPCHLRIKQKVGEAPRRFLRAIPGIEPVELQNPHQCCGHGGTFNFFNYSLSMQILDRRMSEIEQVQPDKIVTGCTGCLLQFQEGIKRIKTETKIDVLHPLLLWKEKHL